MAKLGEKKGIGALGSRARQKLDTRERVRAAAYELFTREGFEETTTKVVAEQAGVATGTVFLHARDKVDLLCLVMHDRLAKTVDAQLATLPRAASFLDQLMHLFGGLFAMYAQHPKVGAAFVQNLPGADGPNGQQVHAMTFAFLHRLADLVREAAARGEASAEVDPLLAAQNLFSLYFSALTAWLGGYATLERALDPGLRASLALQIRGLRP
jgi:TetR/AcrR family transcriptional regulator, cholesterol catabolism regulator